MGRPFYPWQLQDETHAGGVFSALRQKLGFLTPPKEQEVLTFKSRVGSFWAWYAGEAARFRSAINAGKCPGLADEISSTVEKILGFPAWEFGPGADDDSHSFTLTAEGDGHRQLLAMYWLGRAPAIPGWTFYAARQPCANGSTRMEFSGRNFNPIEFWVTPSVDRGREKIDLTVWHPLFDVMEDSERWLVLFLYLDQVLGEIGRQQWVGSIKLNNQHLADAMPISELSAFVTSTEASTGWKKWPPGEAWMVYKLSEPHYRFPRGDVFTGTTRHMTLVNDYLHSEGDLTDPLAGTGADFVFVTFDASFLPRGEESAARGRIEDALDSALRAGAGGQALGGAMGRKNAYIDLLILDGAASLATCQLVLREHRLPAGTTINYFAKERRAEQITLGAG